MSLKQVGLSETACEYIANERSLGINMFSYIDFAEMVSPNRSLSDLFTEDKRASAVCGES